MSKQYKLVKEYPGSPELGTIVTFTEEDTGIWAKRQFYTYTNSRGVIIECGIITVEKFPEFWKKINNNRDFKVLVINNGEIQSVERLSDGAVFSVGDVIRGYEEDPGFTVEHIWDNGWGLVLANYPQNSLGSRSAFLNKATLKKPLFTTEDGVEVFENDKVFVVHLNSFGAYEKTISKTNVRTYYREGNKCFKSEASAASYILNNKPCLSINDVKSVLNSHTEYQCHKTTINRLTVIVEERLEA